MDRVTLTRRDGAAPERLGDGFVLDAEHEWMIEGPPDELDAVVREIGASSAERLGSIVMLSFGNAVGRYRAGPLGTLHVRSGKWTETHYAAMLDEISARAVALPFHAGARSALPYARTEVDAPDVLYHAFVWLRHAVLERADALLIGALRGIVSDPYRRMARDERVVPAELALNVSPRAFDAIAAGVRSMRRVPLGRGLLGGDTFPVDVAETVARPTVDTAENRFVKAFLSSCGIVVDAMRRRMTGTNALSARVRADCLAIEGELAPIVRHRIWGDVGAMRLFPASSTVLQRRAAYREVLWHHILLRMASTALPLDAAEVQQLLEVKDIARLYELWTAFAVVEAVSVRKGAPSKAHRFSRDDLGASLESGILVGWNDGTEVAYNASYTHGGGFRGRSWSLRLRPDVALFVPEGRSAGLHVLDAKFRLSGSLVDEPTEVEADAKVDDLHKMHTYRDAISLVRSAWVMYPGTEFQFWPRNSAYDGALGLCQPIEGIGAVPVVPGFEATALAALVGAMLDRESSKPVRAT